MMLEDDIVRRYSLGQKLWWLILGRVIAALFLFCARDLGSRKWSPGLGNNVTSAGCYLWSYRSLCASSSLLSRACLSGPIPISYRYHPRHLVSLDHRCYSFALHCALYSRYCRLKSVSQSARRDSDVGSVRRCVHHQRTGRP